MFSYFRMILRNTTSSFNIPALSLLKLLPQKHAPSAPGMSICSIHSWFIRGANMVIIWLRNTWCHCGMIMSGIYVYFDIFHQRLFPYWDFKEGVSQHRCFWNITSRPKARDDLRYPCPAKWFINGCFSCEQGCGPKGGRSPVEHRGSLYVCPNVHPCIIHTSERLVLAPEKPILASERPVLASDRPVLASERLVPASEKPVLASLRPGLH